METDLKQVIAEIIDVVKTVPANLQEKCFEVLLNDHLTRGKRAATPAEELPAGANGSPITSLTPPAAEDLQLSDLHAKARKFLEKHDLSVSQLNELFYKEDGELKPLYDDLKTTKMAEGQVRIALLQALQSGIFSGDFRFNREAVRKEAQVRKYYDQPNFASNFKSNQTLFDDLSANSNDVRLSTKGLNELASLVKLLQ